MPFSTAFFAFKAFALASALGGAEASFFTLGAIFMKRVSIQFLLHHDQEPIDRKYKDLFLSIQLHFYVYPYDHGYYWLWSYEILIV